MMLISDFRGIKQMSYSLSLDGAPVHYMLTPQCKLVSICSLVDVTMQIKFNVEEHNMTTLSDLKQSLDPWLYTYDP